MRGTLTTYNLLIILRSNSISTHWRADQFLGVGFEQVGMHCRLLMAKLNFLPETKINIFAKLLYHMYQFVDFFFFF